MFFVLFFFTHAQKHNSVGFFGLTRIRLSVTGKHRRSLLLALCDAVEAFVERVYKPRTSHLAAIKMERLASFKRGDVTIGPLPLPVSYAFWFVVRLL